MSLRSIRCIGKIQNDGNLPIIDKGFCYSDTEPHPNMSSNVFSAASAIIDPDTNEFTAEITGLKEATVYWINSYARNSKGVSLSNYTETKMIKTFGIVNFPTITVYVLDNGINKNVYEMGTSNLLTLSGETVKNEESVFINGYINQTSNPQPSNPIMAWYDFVPTYSTSNKTPPININFSPREEEPASWIMTHDVYYNCGSPQYQISASTVSDGVFPFLWVLKPSIMPRDYFSARGLYENDYFYMNASDSTNLTMPTNGKIIEKRQNLTFKITPSSSKYSVLNLGYPSYYGDIRYKIDNGDWGHRTLREYTMNTGKFSARYEIVDRYFHSFKILQLPFVPPYSPKPIDFHICFDC